ncbi:pancreatic lipase-related protein 2-like [Varanus komodoensis]|uniref:pancreatic lipase-related protein 2-like n=1 Tax=Varanus komodoensis TaxID=61221 RepID=UPI001CF7D33C|nr:pancreatic lipase-related protein 2-like [Varanus komodoensis]
MCDNRLGCFTNDPPWGGTLQRPALNLPEPPEVVNTTFLLHTRENPTYFQVISAIYPSTIRISNFRTNRITRFIIHGHFAADDYLKIVEICKLLLLKEDINCIVVKWKDGSDKLYINAVQNIRIVGAELAYLLDYFEKNCGYSPSNVHIIGHSLGAHAGGEAGRRKRGLTRITGLDPAGPLFHNTPPEVRLDPSDATFVDVIHTNAGHLFFDFARGIIEPCGHLDFYPNGGERMPGCKKFPQSSKLCNISGAMRDKTKEVHQVYYLNTGAFSPFARWRIHVSVKLIGTPTLRGNITLAFTGNNNVRRQYPVARYASTEI